MRMIHRAPRGMGAASGKGGSHTGRLARAGAVLVASAAVMVGVTAGPAVAQLRPVGAVYTQTNAVPNSVQVFKRSFTGALSAAGSVGTGGDGNPGPVPPYAPQGAVNLHRSGRVLFAVNEGSNTVTSFRVKPDFSLEFAGQVSSNGTLPVSVTSFANVVYVLNGASGNISGFTVNLVSGVLTPIAGSTVALASPGSPAEISFDTFGRTLAVTERASNVIETFALGADHRPAPPTVHPSTGTFPYGFAFTALNDMIVSNAGPPPFMGHDSSVSSYAVSPFSTVAPVDVVSNGQNAACWVSVTPDARFAYVSNFFSKTISRIALAPNGTMTVLGSTLTGGFPLDSTLSIDGRYLYVFTVPSLAFTSAQIEAFQVNFVDGSLTAIATTPANLAGTGTGLAAR
jgi:6-phosphogluconolactonase